MRLRGACASVLNEASKGALSRMDDEIDVSVVVPLFGAGGDTSCLDCGQRQRGWPRMG